MDDGHNLEQRAHFIRMRKTVVGRADFFDYLLFGTTRKGLGALVDTNALQECTLRGEPFGSRRAGGTSDGGEVHMCRYVGFTVRVI